MCLYSFVVQSLLIVIAATASGKPGCQYKDATYRAGETFTDGCDKTCTCQINDQKDFVVACTTTCPPFTMRQTASETCLHVRAIGQCCDTGLCDREFKGTPTFVSFSNAKAGLSAPWYAVVGTSEAVPPVIATIVADRMIITLNGAEGSILKGSKGPLIALPDRVESGSGDLLALSNSDIYTRIESDKTQHKLNKPFNVFCDAYIKQSNIAYFLSSLNPKSSLTESMLAKNAASDKCGLQASSSNEHCLEVPCSGKVQECCRNLNGSAVAVQHGTFHYMVGIVKTSTTEQCDATKTSRFLIFKDACSELSFLTI